VQKAHEGSKAQNSSEAAPSENRRKICLYRNGFTVDGGPLRDNTSPESQAFLSALLSGSIPHELLTGTTADRSLDVALEDRRSEEYHAPPPPAYVAFSKGATLGSVEKDSTDSFIITPELIASVGAVDAIDESKPTTTLQVKTVDGKKLRIKINVDATVLQLAATIHSLGAGADSYILSAGFPPKDIVDGSQTLAQAGLQGSSLTLKKA